MPAGRTDPLVGFYFAVEFKDAAVIGAFRECSGLGSENDVVEYKSAMLDGKVGYFKQPGRLKWENITLKRGITNSMALWNWRKKVQDGDVEKARSGGSIILYSQDHKPIASWNVVQAWPSKLSGPSLNASGNDVAVEELVVVHEGCSRET